MDKKELLVNLVRGFSYGSQLCLTAEENDPDEKLNDELNRMAVAMEELSEEVFGEKIKMDFGMIISISKDPDAIIKLIDDHKSEG